MFGNQLFFVGMTILPQPRPTINQILHVAS
jgi:hypothetical protein